MQPVKDTFEYKADLSDAYHLAGSYFDWIATLIAQAKKGGNQTLLDIAEYLAQSQSDEFLAQAKQFEP